MKSKLIHIFLGYLFLDNEKDRAVEKIRVKISNSYVLL